MHREVKDQTRDTAVDQVLAGLTVAASPYTAASSPYASAATDPYAALSPSAASDPYAAFSPYAALSPYAASSPYDPAVSARESRHDADGRDPYQQPAKPRRRLVGRTTVIIPPLRTVGRQLWLPTAEYEQLFDVDCADCSVYPVGAIVDFSEAAECAYECGWCDDPTECYPRAVEIDKESDSFAGSDLGMHESSPLWSRAWAAARELRSALAADPRVLTGALLPDDLWRIRDWTGTELVPIEEEIRRAIAADPANGLGGAALDYTIWCLHDRVGRIGNELTRLLEQISEDDYIPQRPVENFLFNTAALHPGTMRVSAPSMSADVYALHGEYVVANVAYHSDADHRAVGWRSLFLRPFDAERKLKQVNS